MIRSIFVGRMTIRSGFSAVVTLTSMLVFALTAWSSAPAAGTDTPRTIKDLMVLQEQSEATTAAWQCVYDVPFRSLGNGHAVSTELGYSATSPWYGLLRARATQIGSWELYTFCVNGSDWAIRSQGNMLWVGADIDNQGATNGILRANAASIASWELFDVEFQPTTLCGGRECFTIKSRANGKFVSGEFSWSGDTYGALRARSSTIGGWELFEEIPFGPAVQP